MDDTAAKLPLILIAEDNESNYLLFEYLLKNSFEIKHAHNGHEAIELFRQFTPKLILMDIKMPLLNGYEATREIRKLSPDVPIIAVTAYAFEEDIIRIMNSGFNAYISKPVSAEILKTMIGEFLSVRP